MHNNTWDHNTSRWGRTKKIGVTLCPAERKKKNTLSSPGPLLPRGDGTPASKHANHTRTNTNSPLYHLGRATVLGAVNLTELKKKKKNTPSQRPELAIVLSYSIRLYVIIAWQHTKIKEVALVHLVTRLHLELVSFSFPKGRAHKVKIYTTVKETRLAQLLYISKASGYHHISKYLHLFYSSIPSLEFVGWLSVFP